MYDIYLYGMISASVVYVLDKNFMFPRPNDYAEIGKSYQSIGGEAVNSAIMLSKLGLKTKLDGNWLNPKHAGGIKNLLSPFDIDISRLKTKKDHGTEEIVITDRNSRTIFGNYASFHNGAKQWNDPDETDICEASMVSIDPFFRKESLTAAQICVKNNKPYVTVDCKYEDFLSQNAESVIISHELRDQAYRNNDMKEIFNKYLENCKGLTIFSFGADELWYARPGQDLKRYKPYSITPVDTTGAGDSFRSGIIYGLMKGWDDERIVDFASAVAACVCLSIPHALNASGLDGVNEFIRKNKN